MYALADLDSLAAGDHRNSVGQKLVERLPFYPAARYPLAPISFCGDPFDKRVLSESPYNGHWREQWVDIAEQPIYLLRDAVIHSTAGVILVGDHIVSDNLAHVHFPEHGLTRDVASGRIRVHRSGIRHINGRIFHLLSGDQDGYYHWNMDIMARLAPLMVQANLATALALPALSRAYQQETLDKLKLAQPLPGHFVERQASLATDELVYVPNLTGWGWAPRPEILPVFDHLRSAIGPVKSPSRRLFVSRLDSSGRPLINEGEITAMMVQAGYEILVLATLPWVDQIRAFAEASHIVAPHGAGLTNILYCSQGASVCELQMDSAVNWCFRSLASLRQVRYGCVLGDTDPDWVNAHPDIRGWTVNLDTLRSALMEGGFL